MFEKNNYQIIYLNGSSSAGKSTLARALQNILEEPFLVVGIDQIIDMMPQKLNDFNNKTEAPGLGWYSVKDKTGSTITYKIHKGSFGEKIVQALKDIVVVLAKQDHHIIIDDVSFGKAQVDAWCDALKDFNVLWVGVAAPIEVLEQREKERGDRKIGSARWQAEHVHKGVDYDLMIDTYEKSIDENAGIISKYFE